MVVNLCMVREEDVRVTPAGRTVPDLTYSAESKRGCFYASVVRYASDPHLYRMLLTAVGQLLIFHLIKPWKSVKKSKP